MPEHYGESAGAIGTGVGAGIGALAGSALPGVGTALGAKIGSMAGQAIGGTVGGMMQRRAANQLQPSPVDPLTSSMLQETRRRRRAFETGAAFSEANKGIQSSLATTQKNILRRSGGSVGAAISGMAMAQRGAAEQMGRLQAQGMQLANQVAAQEQSVAQRIAQRRLELQLLRQRQLQAQGQEDYSTGMQNIMALAADSPGVDSNFSFQLDKFRRNRRLQQSGLADVEALPTVRLDQSQTSVTPLKPLSPSAYSGTGLSDQTVVPADPLTNLPGVQAGLSNMFPLG